MADNRLIVGLDVGATKTCCVAAEVADEGELIVSGLGVSPSRGLKRGVVVDIDATVHSVEEAVGKAARHSGREIDSVYVGVTGQHFSSVNSRGVTAITNAGHEIREDDVERVEEQSRVIVLPPDRIILHAIPRTYTIDGHADIRRPVGMSGTRLEVETHLIHGSRTVIENIEKCVTRAGLALSGVVLASLATAEAVLTPDERALNVCLVDIGGSTTDVSVYAGGEVFYSAVVPVGGNHVTNDLAQLLMMTMDDAEALKLEHGHAALPEAEASEVVTLQRIGDPEPKRLPRSAICPIIEARMTELFEVVLHEMHKSGCHQAVTGGVVLTGGGSLLKGALQCAAKVMEMPVRLGKAGHIAGLGEAVGSPRYATGVGLVRYGYEQERTRARHTQTSRHDPLGGVLKRIAGIARRFGTSD